ncbi:antitoxin Xre/MbcA/ParS toxin-binding domain-containing protein [Sphingopyxis sp. GW247-27LB]|uniref:antitoxin Xre/MbcA/ParS toxin-binding domain-containing protein n=1 Tax=Sphingopyxis sp. GW247-27LB TaxID=2012632 RepID=UPI000BA64D60|nr:antitoxin Xre/MbcA/ParS toxin-binding domain-containing protein [Sphingopyxis sp. GW247-27LB]PAL24657.1 XRE family transcriptional regulator [Sphingopyxis sp. GW247-27LB]
MAQVQRKIASRSRAGTGETGGGFVARFMDKRGLVDVERVADAFRMTKGQLAETAGLGIATISKADRRTAPRAQTRVTEVLEIISRVRDWAGGETQAMAWYRSQPIPALDGRTPEALVKSGRAGAVRDYLDHLALGGFA